MPNLVFHNYMWIYFYIEWYESYLYKELQFNSWKFLYKGYFQQRRLYSLRSSPGHWIRQWFIWSFFTSRTESQERRMLYLQHTCHVMQTMLSLRLINYFRFPNLILIECHPQHNVHHDGQFLTKKVSIQAVSTWVWQFWGNIRHIHYKDSGV